MDRQSFRRIEQGVKFVERKKRSKLAGPAGPRVQAPQMWFRTTSTLAAATDTGSVVTLNSGTAKLQMTAKSGSNQTIVDAGQSAITIWNGLNGSIASGKIVLCSFVGGLWIIDLVWC